MSNADRIEELRSKYEENPRRYFAPLANEFRKAGDLAQAIAICREHLPKQPGHMSGYIVFGQTLFEANNLEEARSVFEQALTLDPENLIALKHLGDIARMNGENSVARRWYARVLDADPRNDDIASQLASLGAPTPAVSQPAISPTAPASHFAAASAADEALGVFATFDPSALLDLPENFTGAPSPAAANPEGKAEFWAPSSAAPRMPAQHEPLDLDFPEDGSVVEAEGSTELAEAFEEGLLAPEWPDTSELVARLETPVQSSTPVSSPASPDEIAAFGRERTDALAPSQPERAPADELVEAFLPPDGASANASPAAHDDSDREGDRDSDSAEEIATAPFPVSEIEELEFDDSAAEVVSEQEVTLEFLDTGIDGTDASEAGSSPDGEEKHVATPPSSAVEADGNVDTSALLDDDFAFADIMPWDKVAPVNENEMGAEREPPAHVPELQAVPEPSEEPQEAAQQDAPHHAHGNVHEAVPEAAREDAPETDHDVHVEITAEYPVLFASDVDAQPKALEEPLENPLEESFADISSELASERAGRDDAESAAEEEVVGAAIEDVAIEDVAIEDVAIEDVAIEDVAIEDIAAGVVVFDDVVSASVAADDTTHATTSATTSAEVEAGFDADDEAAFTVGEASEDIAVHAVAANVSQDMFAPSAESSTPFVTETMAELLVAQGLLPRAIEVYDELVRRRPHDPVLVARLTELQQLVQSDVGATEYADASAQASGAHVAYATPLSRTPIATPTVTQHARADATPLHTRITPRGGTPVFSTTQPTPFSTQSVSGSTAAQTVSGSAATQSNLSERHQADRAEAFQTARERLAELSRRRVARRTPTHATAVSDESNEGLSSLFGTTSPASTDELAARALADAFGPVPDSGESLFEPASTPTPVLPLRALTPRTNTAVGAALPDSRARAGTAEYSFDRFFPDPAIARNELDSTAESASTPSSQTVNEDLAQFSAWLKGLNNA